LKEDFQKMDSFFARDIEKVLRDRAAEEGVEAALLIHASRVLVLGMAVSPSIFDVLELIGREKTVERLSRLEELL
jgi:glutamyl/glutaminyl-tRNA synthetase